MIRFLAGSGLSTQGGKMKNAVIPGVIMFLMATVVWAGQVEPVADKPDMGVTIGGEAWGRYLHLDLQHWQLPCGERLPQQDLFYYGGKVTACGPIGDGALRWRLGGSVGMAGNSDDDINEVNLAMITGGLTSGLSWRPATVGISLDLTIGGSGITTEIKRAEEDGDWNLYERRDVALFYWEPLLSFDIQLLEVCVLKIQGGYTFLYGKGSEVGGPTAGLAVDLGRWM
jgi:hypothetical protein